MEWFVDVVLPGSELLIGHRPQPIDLTWEMILYFDRVLNQFWWSGLLPTFSLSPIRQDYLFLSIL